MEQKKRILIVGGGLSGLTLAYYLSKENVELTVLEASSRLGGRIQTIIGENDTPMELGATWFSAVHTTILSLLIELGLEKYPQFSKGKSLFQTKSFEPPQEFFIPEAEEPSYRIVGGTQRLIDTLAEKLPNKQIHLNTAVREIKQIKNDISVETKEGEIYRADKVIICMPPQLVSGTIKFTPVLPINLTNLLPTVQTWMSGAIKFVIEYDEPFWRKAGFSGMLFSHAGIVSEMYDHTNSEENKFGFTGFLNGGASSYSYDVRKEFVLKQLSDLLGEKANAPSFYSDKIWSDEYVISGNQFVQQPHQNNGHALLQESYMNGQLFFSNTETSTHFSGYMEGAVRSAKNISQKLFY